MMNKKGSIMLGIWIAIIIWVFGIFFLPFLADDITTTRSALDCTNSSISFGTKLNCLNVGITIPSFIWLLVSLALGLIIGGLR